MKRWSAVYFTAALAALIGLFSLLLPGVPQQQDKSYGKALIGGAFTAQDHLGNPITEETLKGRYSLVYFGFTHCPDICPTGLLIMSNALQELGTGAQAVRPVFVTLDPERDTPEVMARYVAHFHPNMLGITGTREQINAIASTYKVYHQKAENPDSALGYMIDHSGFMYLMSPDGEYITHFPHNIADLELRDALHKHIVQR